MLFRSPAREVALRDELEDVAHRGGEALRARGPRGVVPQQPAVLLHRGATTGGVHDHVVDAGALEGLDVGAGEVARGLGVAGVDVERAAAALLGWRDDRQDLLATCDVCVFPSRYEPFGIVSIEAWAAKVPLIATRSAGPGALIEDGSDGLLVPIDDRAALTEAMNRLIGDRALQAKLVAGGRRRYEAEFTEAAVVASYKALFEKMLSRR